MPVLTLTREVLSRDIQMFTRKKQELKIVLPRNAEVRRPRAVVVPRRFSPSRAKSKSARPPTLEPATSPSPPPMPLEIMTLRSLPVLEILVLFVHLRYAHAAPLEANAQSAHKKGELLHKEGEHHTEHFNLIDIIKQ
jgi:hypothetical protein